MHDNKDTSELSKIPEQPARAAEQKGWFTRAADKIGLYNGPKKLDRSLR